MVCMLNNIDIISYHKTYGCFYGVYDILIKENKRGDLNSYVYA